MRSTKASASARLGSLAVRWRAAALECASLLALWAAEERGRLDPDPLPRQGGSKAPAAPESVTARRVGDQRQVEVAGGRARARRVAVRASEHRERARVRCEERHDLPARRGRAGGHGAGGGGEDVVEELLDLALRAVAVAQDETAQHGTRDGFGVVGGRRRPS